MNIRYQFRKLVRRLRGEPEISDQQVYKLMDRLLKTNEDELSCDEVFELIDEYAEANLPQKEAARLKPLILHHLDMCRECDEEYEALLKVLEETSPS